MATLIENPILNSPYQEPTRRWQFGEDGITDEILDGRRPSAYFKPIPASKRRGGQLAFEAEWTKDRIEETKHINQIRERIAVWRTADKSSGTTAVTKRLLDYWRHPDRDRRLFFCQVEALETLIYITEVAPKKGQAWIETMLREANDSANPGLHRLAVKMATGSGKTTVMGMLIAWHALNKLENPQDPRFSDAFLVVAPGITIRDRLRVLLPSDPNNIYKALDLVPPEDRARLNQAKIVITNYHAFLPRERGDASRLTKKLLGGDETKAFTESPGQVVRRVCRELGNKRNIIVLNDEAHHCYRSKPEEDAPKLKGEERVESKEREKAARVWLSGLEAVKAKMGIKAIYDLSATPFFLRGSGYPEGTLFPWVVSDFALIDAIECGIVKIPRVPVDDNAMTGTQPTYRDLWIRIRDELPKKNASALEKGVKPVLPLELEGALQTLYRHYEKQFRRWETDESARAAGIMPPVFIVVCNNTAVSKLVFDHIAGWEKALPKGGSALVPGELPLFSNVANGKWSSWPSTILIDSAQLESGEAMSPEFKKFAAVEIEEFKEEYRQRFPGRDPDDLTDEDLLREVMNTVGKPGKLGENIRCVVSVSMLTEGWDANTVTHILGARAFQTQLLCEQVVGRGLRRRSFALDDDGFLTPEYAEVYGVPFSFIPCAGSVSDPKPERPTTHVRALPERAHLEITFPRVVGYRYELPPEKLTATFTPASSLTLSTQDLPTTTDVAGVLGEKERMTLDDLKARREQEVAFRVARLVLEQNFGDEGAERPWLFPQLLQITKRFLAELVVCKDNTFPQLLLLQKLSHEAADKIYKAIVRSLDGDAQLVPVLRPHDPIGSTEGIDFDTTKPVYPTDEEKSHLSHCVLDTQSWEQKVAQSIEEMDEVAYYVKNTLAMGFTIPYAKDGQQRQYLPDYIVKYDDGHGPDDLLNLIVEVSGPALKDKAQKVQTAQTLWVPAVNAHGGFGRWAFMEVTDPWECQDLIRSTFAAPVATT